MQYQHGDHFWAWMRLAALALHWYNPLVWAAAILSKRDAELACDEAVLRWLGAEERHNYGETLLSLSIPHVFRPLSLSTSMSESKKSLHERIVFIARSPHMKLSVLLVLILLCSAAVGITFPGSAKASYSENIPQETLQEDAEPVTGHHEFTQKETVYPEETSAMPSDNNTVEEPAFPVLPDVPNAEQQYQLLMDQHEKWEFKQSSWSYTFTDLDHNGRMEVIADYIAGSSFLTYSNCFEVNENMDGIASCLTENQNYSILQIQEELPCYFDASSGLYYYINEHRFNISGYMHHSVSIEALCLHNGFMERIGLSYKQVDYENYGAANEVLTLLLKDGDGNIISEDEYNTLVERRFAGMEKSTLPLIWKKSNGPIPVPTPDPFAATANLPRITKNPTDETVPINGKCQFVTRYENADLAEWHFISPDGYRDLTYADAEKEFPTLQIINGYAKDMTLDSIPAALNGWRVYCRFSNNAGSADFGSALITVQGAPAYSSQSLNNSKTNAYRNNFLIKFNKKK